MLIGAQLPSVRQTIYPVIPNSGLHAWSAAQRSRYSDNQSSIAGRINGFQRLCSGNQASLWDSRVQEAQVGNQAVEPLAINGLPPAVLPSNAGTFASTVGDHTKEFVVITTR